MIHTFYSNAYEGLEAALIQNIREDLRCDPSDLSSAFKKAVIVRPSSYIEDRLARSLADRFSITSGVEFLSLFGWLQPKVGATFRSGSTGSAIDWEIWEALNNPDFIRVVENLRPRPDKFLKYVEKNRKRDDLVELSGQLGTIFSSYASHRIDWVLDWLGDKTYKVRKDKQAVLSSQEDYAWQKALWQYMWENDRSQDLRKLKSIGERVDAIRFEGEESTAPVHLFMPFAFPPLLLPFVRAYGQKENAPDLWIYILNPSQEYWFDAMPKTVFDWSIDAEKEDGASRYLKSSNASGRAMIDRLYRFLNADVKDRFETDSNLEAEIPAPKGAPSPREFERLADLRGAFDADYRYFDMDNRPDVMACYFDQPNDTYLQKFQNSILKLDDSLLPEEAQAGDDSIRIFKAPSFTREIESLADWFHHCFKADPELKPSDIVVMVPNINDAAPQIEAAMTGLPPELYLPWRLYGNSLADSNLTVTAILDFGRLIAGDFDAADFTAWLELPVVQERWGLTLSDVATLAAWLQGAGFRRGLSSRFQHFPTDDRATLEDALERLTFGYFLKDGERRVCGDLLPAFGEESGGFDNVKDERGRLLKVLSAVFKNVYDAAAALYDADKEFTAQEWYDTVLAWMTALFTAKSARNELAEFRNSLYRAVSGMKDGLDADKKVPFAVFWKFLETQLQEAQSKAKPSGAITFTSLEACRGAPFKIVVLAGFAEGGAFPGRSFHYDFDLMGVDSLKRRADRDSREDNKARFFDAMMSARGKLVISYSIGTQAGVEGNPASAVQNFLNYFTSNASKENREAILRSMEVKLPLNAFSRRNFETDPAGARNWQSPRAGMLKAIRSAISSGYREELPLFANAALANSALGCLAEDEKALPVQSLVSFFSDPDRFLMKRHRLSERFETEGADFDWMLDTDDHLIGKLFRLDIWTQLKEGYSRDEIESEKALDPGVGLSEPVRRLVAQGPILDLEEKKKAFASMEKDWGLVRGDIALEAALVGPGDDKFRKKLQATDVPGVEMITRIIDRGKDIAQDKDGFLAHFEPELSSADLTRAKIRLLVWLAAGREGGIFCAPPAKIVTPVPQEEALDAVRWMTAVLEATRRCGFGFTKKGAYNRSQKDSTELLTVCFRGVDKDLAQKIIDSSDDVTKKLKDLWKDSSNLSVAPLAAACKELALEILEADASVRNSKTAEGDAE
jgi:exonuclease V gamma subunit